MEVSALLRELILALAEQSIEYSQEGRNCHIVALILGELNAVRSLRCRYPDHGIGGWSASAAPSWNIPNKRGPSITGRARPEPVRAR
jgi:hypothetical protein